MGIWPFKKGTRELSEELRSALFTKFGVESKDTGAMRYVAQSGSMGSGRVTRVCIFDPAALSGPEVAACNYDSLMSLTRGPLFSGHILEGDADNRMVFLTDRRS